jgi:hypothetical protein
MGGAYLLGSSIHLFAWALFLVFLATIVIGGFLWLTRRGTGLDR